MPNISELKESKYLKKEDVGQGALLTVKGCVHVNVAKEGDPQEMKWALLFHEVAKPFILNSTNGQIIAGFLGKDNTDDWVGHKIVLFHNPAISYGGRLMGGISARAPRNQQPKVAPAMPQGPRLPTPPGMPATWPVVPEPPMVPAEEEEDPGVPF